MVDQLEAICAKTPCERGQSVKGIMDNYECGELAPAITVTIPSRWQIQRRTHAEALEEIRQIGQVIERASQAVCGAYMRICDIIRESKLTEDEVRKQLAESFPPSRISEILKVAHAPEHVWAYYKAGTFGFKGALKGARLYGLPRTHHLTQRQIKRAIERLILLTEGCDLEMRVSKWVMRLTREDSVQDYSVQR